MKKDRRPTSAISSQRQPAKEDVDPFDEDETEKKFLSSKPTCFIVFGKPGSGKTSLCKSLSRIWKCQFVNGPNSIAYSIELQTELGKQAQDVLQRGESVSEELSVKILEERLQSTEVSHYGYVLDDFPSTSEEYLSIDDQFEFLKKLPLKPDYLINLRIPDEDLKSRRKGFLLDPLTNEVYTEEQHNPPVLTEEEPVEEEEDEDEEDERENEGENEAEEYESEEDDEEFEEGEDDEELAPDLIERLIPRIEDFEENVEASIKTYKDVLLRKIEHYMGNHERPKVVELDANLPKNQLIKALVHKLDSMAATRAIVPLRLQGGDEEEDIPDDTETDDLLRTLAATETVAPRFRWRRSRWGRVCPVALYEGNVVQGSPQFAVSFLDKLYVMSSMDALGKFMRNPRLYIMGPQPQNPCKLCIVGPSLSGKTALANRLAEKYGAKVFHVEAMMKPRQEVQRTAMIENVRKEALESAITRVTAILQQEKLAAEQAKAAEEEDEVNTEEGSEKKDESETEESEAKEAEVKDEEAKDGAEVEEEAKDGSDGKVEEAKDGGGEKVEGAKDDSDEKVEEAKDGSDEKVEEAKDGSDEKVEEAKDGGDEKVDEAKDGGDEKAVAKDGSDNDEKGEEEPEGRQDSRSRKGSETEDKGEESDPIVDENHPQVKKIVDTAVEEAMKRDVSASSDEYIELIEEAIHDHYNKMQAEHPKGPIAGRWILDDFPHTREQFNLMIERGIVPDHLICLKDNSDRGELLLRRWYKMQKQGVDITDEATDENSTAEDDSLPKSAELDAQRAVVMNFDKNWTSLQGALRSVGSIEPCLIDCDQEEAKIEADSVEHLEEQFQYKGWEYTGMDQDEEEEDLANEEEEEYDEDEEEEDVFNMDKKKPFGDTRHYCPVVLKDDGVLWPGSPDCAAKYREKVYYFSTPEARTKFLENPNDYLAGNEPLKPPALRLIMLGAKGSGKTLVGKELAKKFGVFHISFKDRLQELILAKTKKRIGPDYPEEEPEADETETEESDDTGKEVKDKTEDNVLKEEEETEPAQAEPEVVEQEEAEEVEFSEIEANIRDNILDNEPLTNETLESILPAWWREEPFKSTGFILESFPRNPDEARYLSESGLYPDCVVNLATEEDDIIKRLLPPLLEKWKKTRDKKLAKKQKELELKLKKRNEEKERRKDSRLKEIAQRRAERQFGKEGSQDSDEDSDEQADEDDEDEEEEEDIDAVIEAEMLEEEDDEEEEEEEETEEEATDRIRLDLAETYDTEIEEVAAIQEVFEEFLIPRVDVEAGKKARIVQFVFEKSLKPMVEYRGSLFDRSEIISASLSKKMLIQGYKQMSKFGKWCPVQLSEGNVLPPCDTYKNPLFPVIYRQHIYFFSSEQNREKFVMCPFKYLHQPAPKPIVPIHLAVVGPPKSGKTTLVNRFVQEYGVKRLSAGEALRKVVLNQSQTALAKQIKEYLRAGEAVPDELVAQAIFVSMLDIHCQTRGYILDGYPVTARQIQFLTERSIIPYKVVELSIGSGSVFVRAERDRISPSRTLPLHDSHMITAVKLRAYLESIGAVKASYEEQNRNFISIDGEESKWKNWNVALVEVKSILKKIQIYLDRSFKDKAACISELCITPSQLSGRLGIFGHYCPVSFVDKGELVDCAEDESQKTAAEFRGHYYKLATELELGIFLENPERYTPPDVDKELPPGDLLPRKLTGSAVKEMFPVQIEMAGFCPVTYLDGDLRYEALIPGDPEIVASYEGKLYLFLSEANREKFMRLPGKYSNLKLPNKLPPKREPISVSGLPMLGFMEQTVEISLRKAITAVGCMKPKFPFLSAKQSALIYLAYHLKAYNPKASEYVRKKYKKKLESFEVQCDLIKYLSRNMTRKFKEPEDRLIDFDNKLSNFMSLKEAAATGVSQ